MPVSSFNGLGIAGIGMTHDAHSRIRRQNTLKPSGRFRCSVGYDDLSGMLAVTDPPPPP